MGHSCQCHSWWESENVIITFGFVQGSLWYDICMCVGGILVVPDDVYGDVWVILVSAIHVGVLEMSL